MQSFLALPAKLRFLIIIEIPLAFLAYPVISWAILRCREVGVFFLLGFSAVAVPFGTGEYMGSAQDVVFNAMEPRDITVIFFRFALHLLG